MSQKIKTIAPLVCFLLAVIFVVPTWATEYATGITAGQYVKFGNYVVTTPAEVALTPEWTKIEVVEASTKEVTLRITGEYKNGTAIPESQLTCNIESGMTNGHQRYIIATNLNQGDKILTTKADVINVTETRTYLGTSRTVNILNFTSTTPTQTMVITYVYDQASGMNLEMSTTIVATETYTNSYSIIDTNIFDTPAIPEFQLLMILPMFITATLLVILIRKRTQPQTNR